MADSIYWHDYETFGRDPRRDRASQFAGIRTDLELNEIGEPLSIYCRPAPDYLPHPEACLITGITPQLAQQQGLTEAEFVTRIHEQFSQPGTCVAGYNSIRFDDEVTRQLLYRNFHDPYEREWKHGNSRWDIIDMMRLCHALRPEGIQWPRREDGTPSFRLEDLSAANGIEHEAAHDALSDVRATIALARLVRTQQPKLFEYFFQLRNKRQVLGLIDRDAGKPLIHVSALYSAAHGRLALVMPLAMHPEDKNGVLFYDLRVDPSPWLDLELDALQAALFTPQAQRAEGEPRLPVNVVHVNRCPALATSALLDESDYPRFNIDLPTARKHWQVLRQAPGFVARLAQAFVRRDAYAPVTDPDYMLYSGGFFSDADRRLMQQLQTTPGAELAARHSELAARFADPRVPEMLFRYVARNYPQHLAEADQQRWLQFCRDRLLDAEGDSRHLTLERFEAALGEAQARAGSERDHEILEQLMGWAASVEEWLAGQ